MLQFYNEHRGIFMKTELRNALGQLNGLIFKGLREENPDNKMAAAMSIVLQMSQLETMIDKVCSD